MKKLKNIFTVAIISLLLLTGCSEKTDSGTEVSSKSDMTNSKGTLVCTRTATAQGDATANLSYEVSYNDGLVSVVRSTEEIISTDQSILDIYENAYKSIFKRYKDLKYYDNTVTRDETSVVSETTIQYNRIDLEKLKELENTDESIIKNGKVALKDWLAYAEKFGTTCSEK